MKEIALSNIDNYVMVDDEDYEYLSDYTWIQGTFTKSPNIFANIAGKKTTMTRFILGLEDEDRSRIRFADGNPFNMQKCNLIHRQTNEYIDGVLYVYASTGTIIAEFDSEDYELISKYTWHPYGDNGYLRAKIYGKNVAMHRLIMGVTDPDCPVDHIDRNIYNMRKSNLRTVDHSCNNINQKASSRNSSGIRGVKVSASGNQLIVKCQRQGKIYSKRFNFSDFNSPEEAFEYAERFYVALVKKLYPEMA